MTIVNDLHIRQVPRKPLDQLDDSFRPIMFRQLSFSYRSPSIYPNNPGRVEGRLLCEMVDSFPEDCRRESSVHEEIFVDEIEFVD